MWESLATSRRSDRVLHGAAKLLNVVVGVIALPLWLLGQRLRDPLRRLLARFDIDPAPLPVAQPRERSMDALMADLEAIPHHLHHSDGAMVRKGLADISSFVLAQQREAANLGYAYPAQFSDHVLQGADDEHVAATVGLQGAPARPGLIVVHGLFSSRRFDYVRQIAVHAYYEWGFNVLALDLRSFGLTNLTSQAPTTVGWKEGEDVVAAGRYLKQLGATTVGALGISLGGSAVLGACDAEGADQTLAGGILAVSPPADVRAMARRLSQRLPLSHPAYALNRGFWAMLTSRIREAGWEGIDDFLDPLERVSAPYYGIEAEELWRRASAKEHIADARVPVLVLHPEDDQVIPVEHARMLDETAKGNDLVRVWTLPGGGHGAIDAVDREWFYAVARGFFERWAGYGGRDDAAGDDSHADRPPVKLIYSAAK
jgi:predicted alpha/beta-fold hydrolase